MRILLILLFATVAFGATRQASYEGYKVYRLRPTTDEQVLFLQTWADSEEYDFWTPVSKNGEPVDVMVFPEDQENFVASLKKAGVAYEIYISNVEKVLVDERSERSRAPPLGEGEVSFTKYLTFEEIEAYIRKLVTSYSHVSMETIGKSSEGRNLTLMKISSDPTANKPVIFIEGGMHAREWISPATVLYFANQLVEKSTSTHLLEKFDWYVLPTANPDGYVYTFTNRRLWRKTRSNNKEAPTCKGVDANHNFGHHWDSINIGGHPCQENYRGSSPFSEPETEALRQFILKFKKNVKLYLSLHSYGNLILYPWGYTSLPPNNVAELRSLATAVADKIKSVTGTSYAVGGWNDVFKTPAIGSSMDWVKGAAAVELAFTIILPGKDSGYALPPRDILPVATEIWEGVQKLHELVAVKLP